MKNLVLFFNLHCYYNINNKFIFIFTSFLPQNGPLLHDALTHNLTQSLDCKNYIWKASHGCFARDHVTIFSFQRLSHNLRTNKPKNKIMFVVTFNHEKFYLTLFLWRLNLEIIVLIPTFIRHVFDGCHTILKSYFYFNL